MSRPRSQPSQPSQPNILFVIADDHAPAAISSYGASLVATPNLDRLAREGARFNNCFCTNSICTPARATVLTGKYSHSTGIRTLSDVIDHTRERTFGMLLHDAGYQTAALGKWHLGHGGNSDPAGFDHWSVLPVQGKYVDPEFHETGGTVTRRGYVTDILADMALDWLRGRDPDRPFFLYLGNKPPHKRFMYEESIRIPLLMRGPGVTQPGLTDDRMVLNVDFAPTVLDLAGAAVPDDMPGRSLRPLLAGEQVDDWRTSMYYRYWMHGAHFDVAAHYGVRTETHKLIYYYGDPLDAAGAVGDPTPPEWELFDLVRDPQELVNVYNDPAYADVRAELTAELQRLRTEVGDSA